MIEKAHLLIIEAYIVATKKLDPIYGIQTWHKIQTQENIKYVNFGSDV